MTTDAMFASLERTSRISSVLMGLGSVVVAAALWIAVSKLQSIEADVTRFEERAEILRVKNENLELANEKHTKESQKLLKEVSSLRFALSASRDAIAAFHARDYKGAVSLYEAALDADPDNAYVINLKAYSFFKLGKLSDAIATQEFGLRIDPGYTWGLFDLARFQCAAGDVEAASKSIGEAIAREERFRQLALQDGEFSRLCSSLVQELEKN